MCKDRGLPWSQRRWNTKILCDIYIYFFIDFLLSRIELETLTEDKRRVNRNVCSVFLALWSQAHKRSLFTLCFVCLKPPPHLSVRAEPPPSSQVSPSSPRYVLLWPSLGIPPPLRPCCSFVVATVTPWAAHQNWFSEMCHPHYRSPDWLFFFVRRARQQVLCSQAGNVWICLF